MQYLQHTFSVYMGTDQFRANYDAIKWSHSSTEEHPPVQREAVGSAPTGTATAE